MASRRHWGRRSRRRERRSWYGLPSSRRSTCASPRLDRHSGRWRRRLTPTRSHRAHGRRLWHVRIAERCSATAWLIRMLPKQSGDDIQRATTWHCTERDRDIGHRLSRQHRERGGKRRSCCHRNGSSAGTYPVLETVRQSAAARARKRAVDARGLSRCLRRCWKLPLRVCHGQR